MNPDYLHALNKAMRIALEAPSTIEIITRLKKEIKKSSGPFVWSVLDIQDLHLQLPPSIQSGWIFVLKKDIPSGSHYHPNSIQHMLLVEGKGQSCIGGTWKEMIPFGTPNTALENSWSIIPENTPHEFFPRETDMVVISFHTCLPEELEEVSCSTGHARRYDEV